jgi:glyoxylase-like metal-dependent hydrolase (beta-lactamase superfamily II)
VIAPDRHAWADTGPEPVGPGVHRLPLPLPNDGLRAVNVYVVDLPDGVALIDGGWATPDSLRSLETGLAALGRALGDVRTVLVTHIHRDHYTQAVRLRQKVGTRVLLGAGEAPGLRMLHRIGTSVPMTALHELRRAGAGDLAERILRRLGRNDDFDPTLWEDPDSWLGPGVTDLGGRALRVIPTPGHTRGHVVFLDERERLLFAGDHVLPHITPSIGFELSAAGGMPLADFLDSLQLLRGFADVRLLPAHGAVGASVHGRVEELLAHHEDRLAACLEAVAVRQEATGAEVAGALRWTGRRTRLADLDDFNQMLAVCETAAHLEVLVLRGLLDARTDPVSEPAVARYRPTH